MKIKLYRPLKYGTRTASDSEKPTYWFAEWNSDWDTSLKEHAGGKIVAWEEKEMETMEGYPSGCKGEHC